MRGIGSGVGLTRRGERFLYALVVLGLMVFLAGAIAAPQRTWANGLLVAVYVLGLGLGAIFFIALQYVTGAGWAVALRRVPEAMLGLIWVGAGGVGLVLLAHPSLYPWTDAAHWVAAQGLSGFKALWLNRPFFLLRAAVYVTSWLVLAHALVGSSRRQDADGEKEHSGRSVRLSSVFMVVFAVTFCAASFDWIMSLEPEWYSTIFGMYSFAGVFSSALAAIIVLAVGLRRLGPLDGILREEHLHDLGKLLFAFTTFWMYIWFSQYMLIWYADIPEETGYFIQRQRGAWAPLLILNLFLNWVVPFFALLSRRAKRSEGLLTKVAVVVLAGHWLDLYLMILPPVAGARPVFGLVEIAVFAGGVGAAVLAFFHVLRGARAVPENDPLLVQSLHYHQ